MWRTECKVSGVTPRIREWIGKGARERQHTGNLLLLAFNLRIISCKGWELSKIIIHIPVFLDIVSFQPAEESPGVGKLSWHKSGHDGNKSWF